MAERETPAAVPVPESPATKALARATLALALVAAGVYALAELLSRSGSLIPMAGVFACALAPRLARRRPLNPRAAGLLAVGAIALAGFDWWFVTGDAVLGLGRGVLGIQFVRLWAPLLARERFQVFALSLVHLAAASVLTTDMFFAVLLAVYAVIGTCALVLQFLQGEAQACGAPPPRATARFLSAISGMAVVAIVLTAAIFLVVPRVGAGLLQANLSRRTVKMAGFSDSVRIGDIGEILQGSDTVMQVEFPEGGDDYLTRYRGRVFETCERGDDGRYHWRAPTQRNGHRLRRTVDVSQTMDPGRFAAVRHTLQGQLRTRQPPASGARQVKHTVRLAPLSSPALFMAGPAYELAFLKPGPVPDRVHIDADGTVVEWGVSTRAAEEVVYEVVAWMDPDTGGSAVRPPPRDPATLTACRSMPVGMADALVNRLRSTATDWVNDATDPLEAAHLVRHRLFASGNYRYTLDQPDAGTGDPIEYFLYTARAGHCEYYAVTMVLLMRTLGHPARLVTGFLGGEVNPMGGFRHVRQSDAHAWVEVLGPQGWVTFDPTPRADDPEGLGALFRQVLDYIRYRWYSGVVDYDVRDQKRALESGVSTLAKWGRSLRRAPRNLARSMRSWRGLVGLVCVIVGLYLLIGRRRATRTRRHRRPAIAFYGEFLQWLAAKGVRRHPGQTPYELAAVAADLPGSPGAPIHALTDLFCAARYGGAPLDDAGRAQAEAALQAIKQAPEGKTR